MISIRHLINKLRRLNFTAADREVAELKKQFRREDEALRAQGRGDEIVARNRLLLGIRPGAKSQLVGIGGKLFSPAQGGQPDKSCPADPSPSDRPNDSM